MELELNVHTSHLGSYCSEKLSYDVDTFSPQCRWVATMFITPLCKNPKIWLFRRTISHVMLYGIWFLIDILIRTEQLFYSQWTYWMFASWSYILWLYQGFLIVSLYLVVNYSYYPLCQVEHLLTQCYINAFFNLYCRAFTK